MAYFMTASQRNSSGSTLFFEFQKGPYREKHWQSDSLFLHADLFDRLNLYDLFKAVIPSFNYFGPTAVSPDQYRILKSTVLEQGGECTALFAELDSWATACFQQEPCFSILGI